MNLKSLRAAVGIDTSFISGSLSVSFDTLFEVAADLSDGRVQNEWFKPFLATCPFIALEQVILFLPLSILLSCVEGRKMRLLQVEIQQPIW
jgi:hypothetical protein